MIVVYRVLEVEFWLEGS